MKRAIASLVLVAAMAGPAAADIDVTFEAVDEFSRGWVPGPDFQIRVRGLPQGEVDPIDVVASLFNDDILLPVAESCERMALLAISRPGRYLFRIETNFDGQREILTRCNLIRR